MSDPLEWIDLGDSVYLRTVGKDRKDGVIVKSENGKEIYLSPEAVINFVIFLETGLVREPDDGR